MTHRLLAAGLLLCVAGSCAPHRGPTPALSRDAREQRYRSLLAAQTRRPSVVEADLVIRAERMEGRRLPWVSGRLILERPDRMRIRMGSLFGTALDVAVRGDTLEALVPKERLGVSLASSRDSLGVPAPGGLAHRILTGAWLPPEAAWSEARAVEDRLELRWVEDTDTLGLSIGANGLPSAAYWRCEGGAQLAARYEAWSRRGGVPWPVRLQLRADPSGWTVVCRMERVRFREPVGREPLSLQVPETYSRLTSADLHEVIERIGRERE